MNSAGYRSGFMFRIPAAAVISVGVILFSYLIWEWYWISQQGFIAIKWHTHLMLYVLAAFAGYVLCRISWIFYQKQFTESVCMVWISVCFSLMTAEGFLYITDTAKTATELNGWGYRSLYETSTIPQSHHWNPDTVHVLEAPEFRYFRKTNGLGFSDTADWNRPKQAGTLRILALGDSFTEGDGAPEDSSYVNQLRILLRENNYRVEVFNAGVCGSDPIYNYKEYIDTLYALKPDVIIQTIASGDVLADINARGGLERFHNGAYLLNKTVPVAEWINSVSLLFRVIRAALLDMSKLYYKSSYHSDEGMRKLEEGMLFFRKRLESENVNVLFVFQPYKFELEEGEYRCDILSLQHQLGKNKGVFFFDLLPFYRNLTDPDQINYLYWKQNGHHNSLGYRKMAEGIFEGLKGSGLLRAYSQ